MAIELRIPSAGESISEVEIGEWRKAEGDRVRRDEVLVEIETDKASMELTAPVDGIITKVLKRAGEPAKVNEVIAFIDAVAVGPNERTPERVPPAAVKVAAPAAVEAAAQRAEAPRSPVMPPAIMPAARRALAEQGIKPPQVEGSGRGGRVLKEDVLRHAAAQGISTREPAPVGGDREEEIVPMSHLRRRIASRLVEAKQNAALLTTFNEIDMSAVQSMRSTYREAFEARYGIRLGFMSFFVKAAIDALKAFPELNAEIRDTSIVYHNYFDIGVAVSTDRGLLVPVLRNAERMSFAEIESAVADFAGRARDNKITVDELSGGTFTISNGGIYGSLLSTPIVNPPQSGILGLHAIQDRPVARDGQVVIRPMMYVALTYDHRIVDGREAVTFLKRIKECIENPSRMLMEI